MDRLQRAILMSLLLIALPLGAAPGASGASADDWYSVALTATPDGALAGFQWTIPAGSFHADPDYPNETWMTLEIAALKDDDTEWAVLVYAIHGNTATPVAEHIVTQRSVRTLLTPALAFDDIRAPSGDAAFLRLTGTDWFGDTIHTEGDTLGFVLAARGNGPTEVFFRVLDHAPLWYEDANATADQLHADLTAGGPPATPVLTGTGQGFHHAAYEEANWGVVSAPFVWGASAPGIIGAKSSTKDVQLRENLPTELHPAGPARDLTLASDYFAAEGWARTRAGYISEQGNGMWSLSARGRGDYQEQGTYTSAAFPYGAFVLGYPNFELMGSGAGLSSADFDLFVVDTQSWSYIVFERLELGATLDQLIGADTGEVVSRTLGLAEWAPDLAEDYADWGAQYATNLVEEAQDLAEDYADWGAQYATNLAEEAEETVRGVGSP